MYYIPFYLPYSLLLLFHNLGGKIQISNSTNMILDMQGGFSTKERGGVDVKVSTGCSIYEWDTNTFQRPIVKSIHTTFLPGKRFDANILAVRRNAKGKSS